MTEQAAMFTGDIPGNYDRHLGPVLFAHYAADIAQRAAAASPARVLEMAAGTGIVTRRLRDALPAATRLTASDLNQPMLEVARAKFRPGEQVEFRQADAGALPFADGAFDAVVCQFGVMFFPDKGKSYREVHRVLAPGGRYVFNVWDPAGGEHPAHEVMAGFFPADPPQFFRVPFGYHRIDPIKDALAVAGFTDLRVAVLGRIQEIADPASFARGLIYGNPAIEEIRKRGGVDPERIVEAITSTLHKKFGAAPCRIPMQAIVFEAARA